MTLTPLTEGDVVEALALDARCFPNPGERVDFQEEMQRENAVLLGARRSGRLQGYLLAWCVVDRMEIMNVAVDPDARRKGHGLVLVDAAIREARLRGMVAVDLEVRASNDPALKLYRGMGFSLVGRRDGYYRNPTEDAVLLTRSLA